jgi:HAD superfamily hydrolase (TIGR01662 family)
LLVDYGGTLVEEVGVDPRAGIEWLLTHASARPPHLTLEQVRARADRITREVAARRDDVHLETPWPSLTRLIYDCLGIRFDLPMAELELGYWRASVTTRPIPGAREALERLQAGGMPVAVVSNSSFGEPVIRDELDRHGLAEYLEFVAVSADYSVRKPNVLLFETAAARLGVDQEHIWFVGDRLDTDVAGAKAARMTAVWFNQRGAHDPSGQADITARSWNELLQHVVTAIPPPE